MADAGARLDLAEVPAGLEGLSRVEAHCRLAEAGRNRWVKGDRLGRLRDLIRLITDPMAVMLAVAATVAMKRMNRVGDTRDEDYRRLRVQRAGCCDVAEAQRLVERGGVFGKIVLLPERSSWSSSRRDAPYL